MIMANKSARLWPLRHKLFSVFILIVLVVAGFFVYQRIALELNRQGFKQARSAIDTVYADIVAKVGPPDNSKRVNDCSRPNEEFEQGPLSCAVNTDFVYEVSDEQQANDMLGQVQGVINQQSSLLQAAKPLSGSIKDTFVARTYYHTTIDYYRTKQKMNCEVSFIYDTPSEIDLQIKNPRGLPLEIGIGCSDFAKAQYYPLN